MVAVRATVSNTMIPAIPAAITKAKGRKWRRSNFVHDKKQGQHREQIFCPAAGPKQIQKHARRSTHKRGKGEFWDGSC